MMYWVCWLEWSEVDLEWGESRVLQSKWHEWRPEMTVADGW